MKRNQIPFSAEYYKYLFNKIIAHKNRNDEQVKNTREEKK